jgi:CrcB protein
VATGDELRTLTAVAVGGIIGSVGRWAVAHQLYDGDDAAFPWHTLLINLVGCLLIGIVVGRIERETIAWGFVATGVLGGFTTMSAFAVELNDLADAGRGGVVIVYLIATVAGGLAAVLLGERVSRGRTT